MSAQELRFRLESALKDVLVSKVDLTVIRTNLNSALAELTSIDTRQARSFALREAMTRIEDSISGLETISSNLSVAAKDIEEYQRDVT